MDRLKILLGLLILFIHSCVPYTEEKFTEIRIDFNDPEYRKLYGFRDRQQTDSLLSYFNHPDPTYRYGAAMAFGSIQDPDAVESLAFLLKDPIDEVRAAAAFALGQTSSKRSVEVLVENFARQDTSGQFGQANKAILEAVGKSGDQKMLEALSTISTYTKKDTFLLEGQCLGLLRFAERKMVSRNGTQLMANIVSDSEYPASVRLIAANYLAFAPGIQLDSSATSLSRIFFQEKNTNIRMALAIALGKTKSPTALSVLMNQLKLDNDYRVKANILRSLGNFEYDTCRDAVLQAIKDKSVAVSMRAAQYFIDFGNARDATYYWRMAKDSFPATIQVMMYKAAQRHLPNYYAEYRGAINSELLRKYRKTEDPFEKAAILDALAEFGWNYKIIHQESQAEEDIIIKTAGYEALRKISQNPEFRRFFGLGTRRAERELAEYFQAAIQTADPGLSATAALAFQNKERNFANYLDSLSFIDSTLAKLSAPQFTESYNELLKAKSVLAQEASPILKQPTYNHPIDWTVITSRTIEPKAIIRTNKGSIQLKLFPVLAPGTVSSFINLAQRNFFEGQYVHRVVPNFVIQGGCDRGDGYGTADFTIRSEYSNLHFDQEGIVGMASSGMHTESSQFFITHAPALSLDGRYTIFARVTEGMDIVHNTELGDKIEDIKIIQ